MRFEDKLSITDKLKRLHWGLILLICGVASIGFLSLYSAAGGNMNPWASQQMLRFFVGMSGLFIVALLDIRWCYRLSWLIYLGGLGLLLVVEIMGHIGMGAQRWIDLGFIKLQPSELMKVAVVVILSYYFHNTPQEDMRRLKTYIMPLGLIAAPVSLVLLQPDLGTSLMIVMAGASIFFLAGAPLWMFFVSGAGVLGAIPVAWKFMHAYQKKRVMTFLNPESDPLGAGYHIMQSKIALGSGGFDGKGFLQGTQSRLNFLPEKQTDFIFTLWVEEWGLSGGFFMLFLFLLIFFYGLWIATHVKHDFGRYLAMGLSVNFSLYVFINIAMVMGLIPVVGAPLPLISYGGTSMLAALGAFGLMISCHIHRDSKLKRV